MDRELYYGCALTIARTWLSTLNMACEVERFYPGLDGKDDAAERQDYLEDAHRAGRRLLQWGRRDG